MKTFNKESTALALAIICLISLDAVPISTAFYQQPKALQLSIYARPQTTVWVDNTTLTINP